MASRQFAKREERAEEPAPPPLRHYVLVSAPLAPPPPSAASCSSSGGGECHARYEAALGGTIALNEAIKSGRPLEVRYGCGQNVYGRGPAAQPQHIGKRGTRTILVLECRRRRPKRAALAHAQPGTSKSADEPPADCDSGGGGGPVSSRFVGRVDVLYEFAAMCDFQYMPVHTDKDGRTGDVKSWTDLHDRLIPSDIGAALSWWHRDNVHDDADGQTPLFMLPCAFSRYTTPSPYVLSKQVEKRDGSLAQGGVVGQNLRRERKAFTVTVSHEEPSWPARPSAEAERDVLARCKNGQVLGRLANVFDGRPVWTRSGLIYATGLKFALLKFLLARYAFYISSGPWGRAWCRFGYDPRHDANAAQYQVVAVAFKGDARISPSSHNMHSSAEQPASSFSFTTGDVPPVRAMFYCLCDVHLPIAKRFATAGQPVPVDTEFDTADGTGSGSGTGGLCDPVHGHLPPDALALVRDAIRADVTRTLGSTSLQCAGADGSIDNEDDYEDEDVDVDDADMGYA